MPPDLGPVSCPALYMSRQSRHTDFTGVHPTKAADVGGIICAQQSSRRRQQAVGLAAQDLHHELQCSKARS